LPAGMTNDGINIRVPAAIDAGYVMLPAGRRSRYGGEATATTQQLGALGLLVTQHADEFAVEDEQNDERNEEHDDEVEQVRVDDAVDGVGGQRRPLSHQYCRCRRARP